MRQDRPARAPAHLRAASGAGRGGDRPPGETKALPLAIQFGPGPALNTIGVSLGTEIVQATAAFGEDNYLIEERLNATDSWGPIQWNTIWGPTPVGAFTVHLFWDISLATGLLTRGFSPRTPVYSFVEPTSPANDQHWFDKNVNVMKYWDGTVWRRSIRVFAGSFAGGVNVITEGAIGTHASITFGGEESTWPDHVGEAP